MQKIRNPASYKIDGCFLDRDTEQFCLIHIYKNASISIRNMLNMRGNYFKYQDVKEKDDLITLCIIRHPLERIISIYFYLLRDEDYGFSDQHPTDVIRQSDFFLNRENIEESFKQFIEQINGKNFFSAVTLPQVQFLRDRSLEIEDIDEIFVQEFLDHDFESFKTKYNLDKAPLSHANTSCAKSSKQIAELLIKDVELRKKVQHIYKEDYELYEKAINLRFSRLNIETD